MMRGPGALVALRAVMLCRFGSACVPFALLAALVAMVPACATAPELAALPQNVCACRAGDEQKCPIDRCDVEITVSQETCAPEVGKVEVLVGDQLEPFDWAPGVAQRTCATIPAGSTATIYARADSPWVWTLALPCAKPTGTPPPAVGKTIPIVLNCKTQ